jgi:hypothetical protein
VKEIADDNATDTSARSQKETAKVIRMRDLKRDHTNITHSQDLVERLQKIMHLQDLKRDCKRIYSAETENIQDTVGDEE